MIKNVLFIITLLAITGPMAMAQNISNYCGTPPEKSEWLQRYQAGLINPVVGRSNELLRLPLTIHLVGTSEGQGYFSLPSLYNALCTLNEDFAPYNIEFFIKGDINYIASDYYYEHDFQAGSTMMNLNNVSRTINCYFVEDPAGNCGYYSPWRDAIAMRKSCAGEGDHTWAHEIGHFLTLPHTFSGWEGTDYPMPEGTPTALENGRAVELLDGTNCDNAGDGFCDTPADYLSFRWNCNSDGMSTVQQTDPAGESFRSDGSFFMSYANDNCANRFSEEQVAAMRTHILSARVNMLSNAEPHVPITEAAEAVSPQPGQAVGEVSEVTLEWTAVEGAEQYHVELYIMLPGSSNGLLETRTMVSETSLTVSGLITGIGYRWSVRPVNRFEACGEESGPFEFFLTQVTSDSEAFSEQRFTVFPSPQLAGQPVTVVAGGVKGEATVALYSTTGQLVKQQRWAATGNGQTLELSTEGLVPGMYLLEIRSAEGRLSRKLLLQ